MYLLFNFILKAVSAVLLDYTTRRLSLVAFLTSLMYFNNFFCTKTRGSCKLVNFSKANQIIKRTYTFNLMVTNMFAQVQGIFL